MALSHRLLVCSAAFRKSVQFHGADSKRACCLRSEIGFGHVKRGACARSSPRISPLSRTGRRIAERLRARRASRRSGRPHRVADRGHDRVPPRRASGPRRQRSVDRLRRGGPRERLRRPALGRARAPAKRRAPFRTPVRRRSRRLVVLLLELRGLAPLRILEAARVIAMATQYFAIPASPALAEVVARSRHPVDKRARVERVRSAAVLYVDTIVEGLVLGLAREGGAAGTTTTSLLQSLAGVVKGVAHGLIRGAAFAARRRGACEGRELSPRAGARGLVGARRVGRSRLPAHAGGPCESRLVLRRIACGPRDRDARRLRRRDDRLHRSLAPPLPRASSLLLDLGRFLRAAVEVGHSTIAKGSHAAARHAAEHDGEAELLTLTRFLETRLVDATPG